MPPASSSRGSSPRSPSRTSRSRCPPGRSSDRLDLQVGGRTVSLLEVGPAHTAGDAVVHLADAGIVFTGDILFHGGHPIVWAGPVANWIAACDRVLALRPDRRRPRTRPTGDAGRLGGPQGVLRAPDRRGPDPLRRRDDAAGGGPRHRPGPLRGLERGRAGRGQRARPLPRLRRPARPPTRSPCMGEMAALAG